MHEGGLRQMNLHNGYLIDLGLPQWVDTEHCRTKIL